MLRLMEVMELDELITLGLNHEQQHQELLITDLKFTLSGNPIFPVYREDFSIVSSTNRSSEKISFNEGIYQIGYNGDGFFYDNEKGVHKVYLHDYKIDNFLVSNEDYMNFIEDGAYQKSSLWLDEAWAWVNAKKITSPLYWHYHQERWMQYTLGGLREVNKSEQLSHVSLYEAAAFAEWSGRRLPTEFEWESCG